MNFWDILILLLIAGPVVFLLLRERKDSSGRCSNGCAGCAFSGQCDKANAEHRK